MDNRTIISRLARRSNLSAKELNALTERLVSVIRDSLSELDTVALPGFGSFVPEKEDEHVASVDGRLILMPPSITAKFNPGAMLRKTTRRI